MRTISDNGRSIRIKTLPNFWEMLYALKNLKGGSAKSLTLGATNLAKLNESQIAIATNKNWTLS